VSLIGKNIGFATELLKQEQLVGVPTETVYGLAGNALSERAVLSIFEVKQRPFFDPLILHVSSIEEVEKYALWHDERLRRFAEIIWPGPLTVLLPKKSHVPDLVTSGSELVAIRVPNQSLTLELLRSLDFPLAAPSANPFGYISPTSAIHVEKQLGKKIGYILNGGDCEVGLESTIIGVEDGEICVFRLGGLSVTDIEKHVGSVKLQLNQSSNPKVPGQLKSHYAPSKPILEASEGIAKVHSNKKIAYLIFGEVPNYVSDSEQHFLFNLSPKKDLQEAALNLFRYLRLMDESDADLILVNFVPQEGLGLAINDRLKRALAKA
jgi:L-threonylcarbamoyladenylate synthase